MKTENLKPFDRLNSSEGDSPPAYDALIDVDKTQRCDNATWAGAERRFGTGAIWNRGV